MTSHTRLLPRRLFHGSDVEVREIDLMLGVKRKDFGRGFYTTASQKQAEKFARLKAIRAGLPQGIVSVFEYSHNPENIVLCFEKADMAWLDFVLFNRGFLRKHQCPQQAADIVVGPVADDAVGIVLNQLMTGAYGEPSSQIAKETAIRLLEPQNLHDQIFFKTRRATACLRFGRSYAIKR